jgi:hypothetical protein
MNNNNNNIPLTQDDSWVIIRRTYFVEEAEEGE